MPRKKQYDPEEVTEKAMKLFWERGFRATSLRDLEKAMAINQFSIYSTFQNKEGLFLEALRKFKEHNRQGPLRPIIESEGNPQALDDFLHQFVGSVKAGTARNGCLFANTIAELGTSQGPIREELQDYLLFLETVFLEYLQKAQDLGHLTGRRQPDQAASFLVNNLMGLALTSKILEERRLEYSLQTILDTLFGEC